jgi:hypothetical protein
MSHEKARRGRLCLLSTAIDRFYFCSCNRHSFLFLNPSKLTLAGEEGANAEAEAMMARVQVAANFMVMIDFLGSQK